MRGGGADDFQASDLGVMGEDGLEQKVCRGKKNVHIHVKVTMVHQVEKPYGQLIFRSRA